MPKTQPPEQLCNRPFGGEGLRTVQKIIHEGQEAAIHRTEIARRVGIALNWRNSRGNIKEMGTRVALLRLHRQGWITLPAPQKRNGNGRSRAERHTQAPVPAPPESELCCSLAELGAIGLQKVQSKADSLVWDGVVDCYHYLGYAPLSGAQIRYLITSEQGLVGAIGFGAAAFGLKARDRWVGWDRQQRDQRRELVLNNRRFLILPWIRVRNLASHILSKAARQVQQDFQTQYGYTPVLLETFVEQARFSGGCYRAANWIHVGLTTGRGRNDRTTQRERNRDGLPLPIKQIWLYPLRRDARKCLCAPLTLLRGSTFSSMEAIG